MLLSRPDEDRRGEEDCKPKLALCIFLGALVFASAVGQLPGESGQSESLLDSSARVTPAPRESVKVFSPGDEPDLLREIVMSDPHLERARRSLKTQQYAFSCPMGTRVNIEL